MTAVLSRPTSAKTRWSGRRALTRYPWMFALLLVLVLLVANAVVQGSFFSAARWVTMIATIAPFVLVAFASTPQIVGGRGGIDISMGPLTVLINCVLVAVLIPSGLGSPWIALPILLVIGVLAGLLNGLLVVVGRLQPVIATLATFFVFSGLAMRISPTPEFAGANWTTALTGTVLFIPGGILLIAVAALIWFGLGKAGWVRKLYLVGGDDVAAFSAGLKVANVRIGAYVLGAVFAVLAGIALTSVVQTSQPNLAGTYSLIALAAIALGGTSLAGGRGGLLGSFLGATAIFLLQEIVAAAGMPVSYLQFMYGLLLVVGVVLSGIATLKEPNR